MKKIFLFACFFIFSVVLIQAEESRSIGFGLHFTGGFRYDDVRMCVGSDAGVKGGPIMDLYVDIRIPSGDKGTFIVNIPVLRPILFAAAFDMLQFEPQVSYEYRTGEKDKTSLVFGGGLGIVFHYGPDYKSSSEDRGESFFAMGPLFSGFAGIQFPTDYGNWMPGIKAFYSPLFSPDYKTGQVLGGAVELHYEF